MRPPVPFSARLTPPEGQPSKPFGGDIQRDGRFVALPAQNSPVEAIGAARRSMPTVVLHELRLHGRVAVDGLGNLRQLLPKARILVMTNCREPDPVVAALRHGADGILTKDDSIHRIPDVIGRSLNGEIPLSREVIQHILHHFRSSTAHASPDINGHSSDRIPFPKPALLHLGVDAPTPSFG